MPGIIARSLFLITPEIIATITALIALIAAVIMKGTNNKGAFYVGIIGMLGSITATVVLYLRYTMNTAFYGMIAIDPFSLFFRLIAYGSVVYILLMSFSSRELEDSKGKWEFVSILSGFAIGMSMMASSMNLIMIYLSMELLSIMSYLLVSYTHGSRRSKEAGLKYIIYGSIASAFMLYGMSLLFGLTRTLDLKVIVTAFQNNNFPAITLYIATIFILTGFGFKIAMVPLHMWAPDVYEGAPIPVTALLTVGSKAAGFAVLLRFFYTAYISTVSMTQYYVNVTPIKWLLIIAIASAVTMTVGNIIAIAQDNIKRMLAYSSISHAGYMLVGLSVISNEAISSVLLYLAVYFFMNIGAFVVVMLVENSIHSENINDYKGLSWTSPALAAAMTVFLFSLTGLPPFAGFTGKVVVFLAAIDKGLYWLVILAVINTVISLYYYARVIKKMYFETQPDNVQKIKVGMLPAVIIISVLIPTLLFGIWWSPLVNFVHFSSFMY
ncbi:MAG: NADH-quinone oxidoreductase subunit N [Deltaproteobacteria bacterium]|nr:NADH-quinone oxidoreductase subunit N [Deltaproteobacteria bacterium]MCL5791581.1 NADH-quinone oxidoreductase subunit N [Deltaproteobacteria bacterium]